MVKHNKEWVSNRMHSRLAHNRGLDRSQSISCCEKTSLRSSGLITDAYGSVVVSKNYLVLYLVAVLWCEEMETHCINPKNHMWIITNPRCGCLRTATTPSNVCRLDACCGGSWLALG